MSHLKPRWFWTDDTKAHVCEWNKANRLYESVCRADFSLRKRQMFEHAYQPPRPLTKRCTYCQSFINDYAQLFANTIVEIVSRGKLR